MTCGGTDRGIGDHGNDRSRVNSPLLNELGVLKRLTGGYRAAAVSHQQALELFRDLGERHAQAYALNELGLVQQLTDNHLAAAVSHHGPQLFRDLDARRGQADVLTGLGELSSRTAETQQARDYHSQALVIARGLGAPREEARALEGIGHSHLQDGNPGEGIAHLKQALAIYQRIGAPRARRVQETLRQHPLKPASPPSNQ